MLSQVIFMLSSQSLKCTVPQNENPLSVNKCLARDIAVIILSFVDVKIIVLFLQSTSSPVAV